MQEWWERDGKSDLKIYGTSLALALVVRTVAVEPRYIPSLSMFPTFEVGDQLAVDKLSARLSRPYQRKDVVVFHPPPKFSEFSSRGADDVRGGNKHATLRFEQIIPCGGWVGVVQAIFCLDRVAVVVTLSRTRMDVYDVDFVP